MSYRTTCPHCSSVFRLGQDQLDAAQGWAQCGVCGAAFDTRASLQMENGSPLSIAPEPPEAPAADAETPAAAAVRTPPTPAPADTAVAARGPEALPPPVEPPVGIAQRETPSGLSSIILIDPDIPVPDDFGPMPRIDAVPAPAAPAPLMYPPPYSPAAPAPAAAATPVARIEYAQSHFVPAEPADLFEAPAPRRKRTWFWGSASVLLLGLLLAQSAYFLRDTLVTQLPQTRPALERMCALAGCTLSLPKDLEMLQIVGSDLETEVNGRLKLTLTLGNRSSHAQAWPMLVLTLTDQRNRPLARRSFAPSEYLGDAQRLAAGMPPRSEQPLSLPLAVHDLTPMGFDLQLAY